MSPIKNLLLGAMAGIFAIFLAEGLCRLVLAPVDFLLPSMESHPVLNHRIKAGSAGHDALGFRNPNVPVEVDTIAIGDSMTYGVAASHLDSWPRQLERLAGVPVYNMALGGYGPLHYLHLLESVALPMRPKHVVVGLYFGNDLMDSYNLAYSNDAWLEFRRPDEVSIVDSEGLIGGTETATKAFASLRDLLAQNSILYRIVTQSALADPARRAEVQALHEDVIELRVPEGITFMTPGARSLALDLSDAKVQKGLELTLQALSEIGRICAESSIDLLIALIPTKENVYRDAVTAQEVDLSGSAYLALLGYEEQAKQQVVALLDSAKIQHLDLVEPMRAASQLDAIFPENDGHPNAKGYSIIAKEIAIWLAGSKIPQ